jgi:hypothetical protein
VNPTLYTFANFLLIALDAQLSKVYPHFYILQLIILLALALWLGSRPGGFLAYGVAFVLGMGLDAALWFVGQDFLLLTNPEDTPSWLVLSWLGGACVRVLGPLSILLFVHLWCRSRQRSGPVKFFQL